MSNEYPAQYMLMQLLQKQEKVPLQEVFNAVYVSDSARNLNEFRELLNFLKNCNYASVLDEQGESCKIDKALTENRQQYDLALNNIRNYELEHVDCSKLGVGLESADMTHVDDCQYMTIINDVPLNIYGEFKSCKPQMARLICFTNLIAQLFIARCFSDLESYIHPALREKYNADTLASMLSEAERTNGRIISFDDISVSELYWGEGSGKKFFDDEGMPKGVSRKERVGKANFQLQCGISPNGVKCWEHTVSIWVSETEQGIMQVYKIELYSSY